MALSRAQVRDAWTSIGFTRDFRHLQPVPRWWTQRQGWFEPKTHVVKPKDRIKYWNIVPGDQVRLRGDPTGTVYEVNMINRLSNRVMLKTEQDKVRPEEQMKRGKNVPYAKCQLFIGKFEFPPKEGSAEPQTVFATRLSTSSPSWAKSTYRYEWSRFAVNTVPRLPHLAGGEKDRIHISWPKRDKPPVPEPGPYDTREDAVLEITYTPPALPTYIHFREPAPRAPTEDEYFNAVSKPNSDSYDASQPFEVFLSKELANPHSRAKKQARWQAHQEYKRAMLNDMIAAELKDLQGRSRREARAEAMWKWRHTLEEERKGEQKRRWKNRGAEARLGHKKIRKARKDEKKRERLRNLVLPEAPNQAIPGAESRAA
ncbi:hypothetical protein POSPLADRAFT_1147674 [Postia placenta MAD-698-R-SB12]|uniref:KOW domain-containing protein n=1 Tax=Postia placenta MAD-698-R-SB12 TaxID=670580 RepID=A0A1X6MVR2_9APHY|nr:hypothetical protein POSPLADRAFT_1147674 [Postia placenta MAD-698-R-SB12]OSX60465.1 hypothetical protein POSPLADRAFT_1147674 [Postia placenta MAD-698-R-SB12]